MHTHSIEPWRHSHVFLGQRHDKHEFRTWCVVALTCAMMVAEIIGGTMFGSMAVVADGWHMSTHAGALGIAAFAYRFARRHARDPRFSFGTGKLGELAAFASALILAMIALAIGYEAVTRLGSPVPIDFKEAIPLAALGLCVNLASAWLLFDSHEHHGHPTPHAQGHWHPQDFSHDHEHRHALGQEDDHDHKHDFDHDDLRFRAHHHHHGHDLNIRAAYVHVLADALTSVLAIVALTCGLLFGWVWLDPLMALVGVAVILSWAFGLIRNAGAVLVDMVPDRHLAEHIREHLEVEGDRVSDLHLWRLGPGHTGVIAAVVSDHPQAPSAYKARLDGIEGLSHVTVEVHVCEDDHHRHKAA